ncbi:MAG: tetratricopeptide repeat protein [Promethearchaeota archaeon]
MLKIFLSSTYRDLTDARSKILQQLNSAFKVVGMEEFIPDGSDSQEVCIGNLKKVKGNGIVIFLISPYYGSLMESCSLKEDCKAECPMKGDGHISYTHCEYKTTIAEGILHQTYLVAKGWDAPDVKKGALQFKEEIGKEYLGFVDIEDPNLLGLICSNLATKITEWHVQNKLEFPKFVDREEKLNEIIENINGKVEVWGVGGVGKTALIEVALLIQKLKGKSIITIGTPKTYASGSGFKDFRDKSEEAQYIADSPDQITIYDVINALVKVKLISNVDEVMKMPSNEKIALLSKIVRREKNLILFIDDFHLATEEVVEIAKSVDHVILSSRRNSYIAKDIYLSGIDKEERENLINLFSIEPLPKDVKNLIANITEGHPVSTAILVKNYQKINFNNLKGFDLKNANQGQINDFFRRVIEEIFSSNPNALQLLEDLSVLNTDLETNIDRESIEKIYSSEDVSNDFNELIDAGMLKKKEGSHSTYEFSFKHIQDALEDKASAESHEKAILYYETKEKLMQDKYMIDDEVEILYHKVKSNPIEQLVDELLEIKERLYPIHYGFKRLIHVGEELKTSVNEIDKAYIDLTLGLLFRDLRRFKEAETMFFNSLNVYKKLAEQNPEDYLPEVALTQNNLGALYYDLKRFKEAETMYLDALKLRKELAEKNPDTYLSDFALTQNNLGALYNDLKRFEEAETMFLDALKLRKKLAEQTPEAYLPDLAITQNSLGTLYTYLKRFEQAETMYLDALKLGMKLAEQNPDGYLPDVAMTKNNLGALYTYLNRFEEAETMYLDTLSLRVKLAEQNPETYLPAVALAQNNLGTLYVNLRRFEEAETMYLKALNIRIKLAEKNPDVYLLDIAMTQNNLGNLYIYLERYQDAETMYLNSLNAFKELASQNPDAYLSNVAMAQNNLGVLYNDLNRFEVSETMYLNSLNTYKELAERSPDAYLPALAETQNNLGSLYADLRRFKAAETIYLDVLNTRMKLADQNPDIYLPAVADTQNNLGILYIQMKRYKEAENYFNNILDKYPNYGSAWYNKACLASLKNNKEKALEYLNKAIDLDQTYIDMAKSDEDFNNLRGLEEFKKLLGELI